MANVDLAFTLDEPRGTAPAAGYLAHLGPLSFVTVLSDITEALGDPIETVGGAAVAGERRARPFKLTLPVRGTHSDLDPYAAAESLRRQVRALMNNTAAKQHALWFAFDVDPDVGAWLLIGTADLEYAEGGVTLSEYRLVLDDCVRLGNRRTHLPARRLEWADRRLPTTPRDTRGTIFSADFAAEPGVAPRHWLPLSLALAAGAPVPTTQQAVDGGQIVYVDGRPAAEVLALFDDRPYAPAGEVTALDPVTFERLLGDDQPRSPGGSYDAIPTLTNGRCRARWDSAGAVLVDVFIAGAWVTEAARLSVLGSITVLGSRLVEITEERAVLVIAGLGTDLVVTLQRGWSAPRVEVYRRPAASVSLVMHTGTAGTATYWNSAATAAIVAGTSYGTFTGRGPWAMLNGPTPGPTLFAGLVQEAVTMYGAAAFSSRSGLRFESASGYVGLKLGATARVTTTTSAQEHGRRHLADAIAVPELVAR